MGMRARPVSSAEVRVAMRQARTSSRSFGGCFESTLRFGGKSRPRSGELWDSVGRNERLWRALVSMSPLAFARDVLGFQPSEAQAMVLDRAPEFRQIALNCGRQWGKSTVAAVLAAHRLTMDEGCTVLVVAPSARQSGETLRKVREFLAVMRMGGKARGDGVNRNSMALPNGSRIVGLPAVDATVRGFSKVSMLIVDEAARVPDEVYLALRPSLALADGDVILLSTPRGKRGFFYRAMTDSEEGWLRHTGDVSECSRISDEFLKKERARGEGYFRQEYLCEFVETGKYLFDEALISRMIGRDEDAWPWV